MPNLQIFYCMLNISGFSTILVTVYITVQHDFAPFFSIPERVFCDRSVTFLRLQVHLTFTFGPDSIAADPVGPLLSCELNGFIVFHLRLSVFPVSITECFIE
jgi:hypothetical protein